jgi:hypothetical protein
MPNRRTKAKRIKQGRALITSEWITEISIRRRNEEAMWPVQCPGHTRAEAIQAGIAHLKAEGKREKIA